MAFSTVYLPSGFTWPCTQHQFEQQSLVIVQPTPQQLEQLLAHLQTQSSVLHQVPIEAIIHGIDRVAALWTEPLAAEQEQLLAVLADLCGYSIPMLEHILLRMAQDWRAEALWQRLETELGDPFYVDTWRPYGTGMARLWGPRLTWHIGAGNIPGVAIQSLIDGLLVKSPALVKPATGEPLLAAWWVKQLAQVQPQLAQALAVIWWPSGTHQLEQLVIKHVEAVQINGSNAAINELRSRIPAHIRFITYGSRISCSVVSHPALANPHVLAQQLSYDIAVFDQQGCVSPHIIFVEGQFNHAEILAQALAQALSEQETSLPRGPLTPESATALRRFHDQAEWRELAGETVRVYGGTTARWGILIDSDAKFQPVASARTIVIRPVADMQVIPQLLAPMRSYLQSVALAATGTQASTLATMLAAAGITRIARPGQQAWPAAAWHHDGRSPLIALGRWSDWEAPTA